MMESWPHQTWLSKTFSYGMAQGLENHMAFTERRNHPPPDYQSIIDCPSFTCSLETMNMYTGTIDRPLFDIGGLREVVRPSGPVVHPFTMPALPVYGYRSHVQNPAQAVAMHLFLVGRTRESLGHR